VVCATVTHGKYKPTGDRYILCCCYECYQSGKLRDWLECRDNPTRTEHTHPPAKPVWDLDITVADGKYTVRLGPDRRLHALRYGEPWRDCVGDNLILAMAYEIQALREELNQLHLQAGPIETA
jgi:hypothetical protein